ncbi:SUN domain-containing protein 3-like isoform X1 [Ascaphus truei]|uniref:SUN domain-containing protein 3-like isoform X1 n=1 Tax=Ascaphus truei TaxID=8439 RepID=UPI003F5A4F05
MPRRSDRIRNKTLRDRDNESNENDYIENISVPLAASGNIQRNLKNVAGNISENVHHGSGSFAAHIIVLARSSLIYLLTSALLFMQTFVRILWATKFYFLAALVLCGILLTHNPLVDNIVEQYRIFGKGELGQELKYKNVHEIVEEMRRETETVAVQIKIIRDQIEAIKKAVTQYEMGTITKGAVVDMIKTELIRTEEDHVQVADFALQSAGASIIRRKTSQSYQADDLKWTLFDTFLWNYSPSPDLMLQPNVHPGNCWAFPGREGHALIRLSGKIIPAAVTIQHVAKAISPTKDFSSAPQDFAVYGFDSELTDSGEILGQFRYEPEKQLLQSFKLTNTNATEYRVIQLKILNNWGNKNFTCIYRFRVHQELPKQLAG